ncbi:hypothetical protein TRICI_003283 [Trichomonascus ciferrii]|uniref:Enoyl reductase (ER) domain-containing protein n=1 Tax=Trichomonascus ciferrii TaxID=44093 RepID=A0A642V495_9ASCO|nr:hypothetical protein TRICI_003283 [Trichomonascus ciferrii]
MAKTMKAVVFRGPREIVLEERPVPVVEKGTDAILKVKAAGLCGSELHTYRGNLSTGKGHIMGHEFVGTVVETGGDVKDFKVGDEVISCFTIQCGKCWFCTHGYSSKCPQVKVFGTPGLDGGQAEYVRVPLADSTLVHRPQELSESVLVLMADIFTTGYYGVTNFTKKSTQAEVNEAITVVLGCGPVGLCAIASAKHMGIKTVFAVDSVPDRLEHAQRFGATPLKLDDTSLLEKSVLDATEGRGADLVIEVVGSQDALLLAFKLIRQAGFISSIGYQHDKFPFSALDCYLKNITMQFGRCPGMSLFPESLEVFKQVAPQFEDFVDMSLPLDKAPYAFDLFDKHGARKIVFTP